MDQESIKSLSHMTKLYCKGAQGRLSNRLKVSPGNSERRLAWLM